MPQKLRRLCSVQRTYTHRLRLAEPVRHADGGQRGAGRFLRYDRRRYKHGKIFRIFVLDKAIELFFGYFRWFNNLYLKLNGQSDGTGSYKEPPVVTEPSPPSDTPGNEPAPPEPSTPTVVSYTQTQRIMLELFWRKIKRLPPVFFIDFFQLRPAPSQSPLPHFAFRIAQALPFPQREDGVCWRARSVFFF